MRNLKKILALVLALVMSLSLMATAGATDFKDDENISDTYRQAAQVLFELGVFNGDQNGQFNPDQPIKRSEVAAILYRIATGDVGLEGNKTYAPYNQFPDVTAEDWYAGYVTYCANAGYIKGRNTGKFDAKDNVTGYEVLAMILRAVGYDKNNEFVGSDWQLHTASIAREKGVLVNVLEDPNVQLSNPATREVVAELLFRASLLPQVSWNAATLSYVESGETLAMENLGMEQVEGVVIANEWADLRDSDVTAADQTVLKTADGERTLAVPTDLTDIGESRYAYVVGTKVLGQLEDTGKNVVKDCADLETPGEATYVSTLADGLDVKDAEYYINFSYGTKDSSKYRIEYSVSFRTDEAKEWFETKYLGQNAYYDVDLAELAADDNDRYGRTTVNWLNDTGAGTYYADEDGVIDADDTPGADNPLGRTFSRVIPAGETISSLDKAIMQGIFGSAASFDSEYKDFSKLSDDIIHAGYVYAGSKSNPNTTDSKDDLSDDRTYQDFADEYIGTDPTSSFAYNYNGEWLKIIDNNNDGKAEYVLDTMYDLFEVVAYNDRTDVYDFSRADADSDVAVCRDSEYEFAIGDMLLGAWIDGQYVVEEAQSEIVIVDKYSWKDESVTTRDGAVLYASGANIINTTGYADEIANMEYGVEYEVFYDHYGFIRAFRPVDGDRHYGLLTDLYLDDYRNAHYIYSQTATVELSFLDENGKLDMDEYVVANHNGSDVINPFVGIEQDVPKTVSRTDFLQRAIAHLDLPVRSTAKTFQDHRTTDANGNKYGVSDTTALGSEFDYDGTPVNSKYWNAGDNTPVTAAESIIFSTTNIARYVINEDGTVTLTTAAEYSYNKANEQEYYWLDDGTTAADNFGTNDVTNGVDIKKIGIGYTRATAAAWRAAWVQSNGIKDDAANKTAIDNAMKCLVPVYAVDYVMLDKTNDGANTIGSSTYRFKIDSSYNDARIDGREGNLYNYHVNAVTDTVFYVVTDAGVYPFVGYQKLPTIDTDDITAMYAVARNTSKDNAGCDYWVADVIVIEVPNLGTAYGHMIYNVYDNYRQNQRGIIHELDAIDCVTGELTTVIVDSGWTTPYPTGFYVLAGAEVAADGTVSATGMQAVEDNDVFASKYYAGFGIYAGEVVRSSAITDRDSYIEVFDEVGDENVNGDEIKVPLNGAPWYSVHGYYTEASNPTGRFTATQLSSQDYAGGLPTGDEVIYVVYGSKVVFVIDTTITTGYYEEVPAYLTDGYDYYREYVYENVYDAAMEYQTGTPSVSGDGKVSFTANFAQYRDAEGKTQTFPVPAAITDAKNITTMDGVMKITVSSLKNADGNTWTEPAGYSLIDVKTSSTKYTVDLTGGVITVEAVDDYNLLSGVSLQLVFEYTESDKTHTPVQAKAEDDGVGLPEADWQIVELKQSTNAITKRDADVTNPVPGDNVDLYFTVKNTYKVESVTISDPASIAGTYTVKDIIGNFNKDGTNGSGFVKYYITFELPKEVVDLTINATSDAVVIDLPTGVTLDTVSTPAGGGSYEGSFNKGDDLTNKLIKLKVADTAKLPADITISVGGTLLTKGAGEDYTYDSSTGEIKFLKGTAANPIVITGEVTSKTSTLSLTLSGVAQDSISVQQNGKDVPRIAGQLAWTLDQGVACDIVVKTLPGLTASDVAGTSSNISFTKQADGSWKGTIAGSSVNTDVSSTITATYATSKINLINSTGGEIEVKQVKADGTTETVADSSGYAVLQGTAVTITVKPGTDKVFTSAVTATGLTFEKDGDNYVATLTGPATSASYTLNGGAVKPTAITPTLTPKTGVAMTSGKLTLDDDDTCEATFTVASSVWAQEGGSGKYKASFVVTLADGFSITGTSSGWTATDSGNDWTITGPEYDADTDASNTTVTLTITYAP